MESMESNTMDGRVTVCGEINIHSSSGTELGHFKSFTEPSGPKTRITLQCAWLTLPLLEGGFPCSSHLVGRGGGESQIVRAASLRSWD